MQKGLSQWPTIRGQPEAEVLYITFPPIYEMVFVKSGPDSQLMRV